MRVFAPDQSFQEVVEESLGSSYRHVDDLGSQPMVDTAAVVSFPLPFGKQGEALLGVSDILLSFSEARIPLAESVRLEA